MDKSRHEKVLIIIAAYVIGFVTAYIAYGITKINQQYPDEPVVAATDAETIREIRENTPRLEEREVGLFYIHGDTERLLTVNSEALDESVLKQTLVDNKNGVYYEVHGNSLSPNQKFAYFCEQLAEEDKTCDPFVYEVETDTLHRVQVSNDTGQLTNRKQIVRWGDEGKLFVDTFKSSSIEEPWR